MTNRLRDDDLPSDQFSSKRTLDHSIGKHTVFISHRGIEMKRKFANHLYHSLKERGIVAFLDMEELPEGDDVRPFMLEAARRAIIQVPIFSTTYAESAWCLDELVEMIKSTKSPNNAKVIPVFYDVESEDLRNKNGEFGKAIKGHRQKGKRKEDTIQGWEHALDEASWLEGFRLETYNKCEGELRNALVEKIVQEIEERTLPEVERNAVGLEGRIHYVVERFHLKEKSNVFFLLLWGMGGIGKTTLARAIFNRLGKEFDAKSFVEDCGGEKPSRIQERLLNGLLRRKDFEGNVGSGREYLKNGLRMKKVLIVLDDVKNFEAIEEVIDLTSLHSGSLILVTSRRQSVFPLKTALSDVFEGGRYEVQGMRDDESLRLLCVHAFKKPSPEPRFEKLAHSVSQACGGLPLALEVVGCHLRCKNFEMWEEAIEKLRSNLYPEIEGKLMISYEALNVREQEMFLDVACLLIGKEKRCAEYFWDGLVTAWRTGLESLVDRCLVKVSQTGRLFSDRFDYECLTMHDVLRDLGRAIVEKEYGKSGKWSRVWDSTKILSRVLQSKQGLDQIRGLATSVPTLNAGLLSQMRSLQLLFLDGTELDGDDEGLEGLEIRWLRLSGGHGVSATQISVLKSLTVLELDGCYKGIEIELPISWRKLKRLRKKVPFSCGKLKKLRKIVMPVMSGGNHLPEDFGSLESLEELHLRYTSEYEREFPSSFGQLKKLRKLEIFWCRQLPEDFGSLKGLEELVIDNSKLNDGITKLPSSFAQLKKLRKLHMFECNALEQLPEEFGSLESLELLFLEHLPLKKLPSSCSKLKKLRKLHMNLMYKTLKQLPEEFGSLESLEELEVQGTHITKLPSLFGQLKNLRELVMTDCPRLEQLPKEFGSLGSLELLVFKRARLTKLPSSFGYMNDEPWLEQLPEDFGSLESLEELDLRWPEMSTIQLEDFRPLESEEELILQRIHITRLRSSFWQLKKLGGLVITDCLEQLPEYFRSLQSLEEFRICRANITKLPRSFGQLKKIRKLVMYDCLRLEQLPEDFGSLEKLEVSSAAITKLPSSFMQLTKLRELKMSDCRRLKQLPEDFGSLESLEELLFDRLPLTKLPSSFGQLKNLRKLEMTWADLQERRLKQLPEDFGSLESLEKLELRGAHIMKLPSSFGQLKKLRYLDLRRCKWLEQLPEDFGSLESLISLTVLESLITKLPLGQFVGWRRQWDLMSIDLINADAHFLRK